MDENREPAVSTDQKSKGGKATKVAVIAAAIVIVGIAAYFGITKVIIPNRNYNAAVALMNEGKYEEAIAAFETMEEYKDSVEQITACETGIKDNEYDAAIALMDDGKYEEAIEAFEAMNGYRDSAEMITACETSIKDNEYNAAVALMKESKYEEAVAAFEALNGYKDSAEKADGIRFEYETENMKYAEIGDYIYFGTYEQDNDTANGKESIEWQVLAKGDNKVLVISRYALDCKQYNTEYESVTWETCTLRTWLNGTFLNEAFSEAEQSMIQTTEVSADRNPAYSTNPGNATKDKMFLLSINEANKYFASKEAKMCIPTAYAKANGAGTNDWREVDGEAVCFWWLRSPGLDQISAAVVFYDGVGLWGIDVSSVGDCVRPAMWIDLDS